MVLLDAGRRGGAADLPDARVPQPVRGTGRELDALVAEYRAAVPDGTGTAKALDYTLHRWPALTRYAETGHLPIDNNPVGNAIRPIAVGKKNWLFAGSERAGQRANAPMQRWRGLCARLR